MAQWLNLTYFTNYNLQITNGLMAFRSFPRSKKPAASQELFGAPLERLPQDYLVAHIDGGARGNPGPAGYGVLIEDSEGRTVARLSKYLGRQTNNVAEYSGLLAALEFAGQHPFKAIKVLSDSELLVRQLKGIYKVKHPGLRELYDRAQSLLRQLIWFQIEHIRRERNREADALANAAMDQRAKT
jgi:ribonuclease HI